MASRLTPTPPIQTATGRNLGADLAARLTSRKFWALIAAYVGPTIQNFPDRWRAIIISIATPVYVISEAVVDSRRAGAPILVPETQTETKTETGAETALD